MPETNTLAYSSETSVTVKKFYNTDTSRFWKGPVTSLTADRNPAMQTVPPVMKAYGPFY